MAQKGKISSTSLDPSIPWEVNRKHDKARRELIRTLTGAICAYERKLQDIRESVVKYRDQKNITPQTIFMYELELNQMGHTVRIQLDNTIKYVTGKTFHDPYIYDYTRFTSPFDLITPLTDTSPTRLGVPLLDTNNPSTSLSTNIAPTTSGYFPSTTNVPYSDNYVMAHSERHQPYNVPRLQGDFYSSIRRPTHAASNASSE